MKRYFEHIKSKTPHDRRQHAMKVAGLLTAVAFVVWITTLGVRFAGTYQAAAAAATDTSSGIQQTQLPGSDTTDTSADQTIEVVGTSTDDAYSNYGSQ